MFSLFLIICVVAIVVGFRKSTQMTQEQEKELKENPEFQQLVQWSIVKKWKEEFGTKKEDLISKMHKEILELNKLNKSKETKEFSRLESYEKDIYRDTPKGGLKKEETFNDLFEYDKK